MSEQPQFFSRFVQVGPYKTHFVEWGDGVPVVMVHGGGPGAAGHARPGARAITIVDRPDAPQVEILVGWPTVAPDDPAFPTLEAWASLLGGNVGGRLFRDLRERQGLAYIIDAEQSLEGRFVVSTRARHERVVALVRGIEAHLDALTSVPLEPCEVSMLAERMAGEAALLADDPAAWMARSRADVAALGRPRDIADPLTGGTPALRARLESVADAHLRGAPTVVLVGDADWLRRDLAAAAPNRPIHVVEAGDTGS